MNETDTLKKILTDLTNKGSVTIKLGTTESAALIKVVSMNVWAASKK